MSQGTNVRIPPGPTLEAFGGGSSGNSLGNSSNGDRSLHGSTEDSRFRREPSVLFVSSLGKSAIRSVAASRISTSPRFVRRAWSAGTAERRSFLAEHLAREVGAEYYFVCNAVQVELREFRE
jgi:hypothetical protein